jgi:DNA adenine methylase
MQKHPTQQASAPLEFGPLGQDPARAPRPFLRWAGGKQKLLKDLIPLLPTVASSDRLIEPFVGAGSVFLGTAYDSYLLNDANPDLIAVWNALKCRPAEFIATASSYFVEENRTEQAYMALRQRFNRSADRYERATLFPYLNRFNFNGLYRVNSKDEFNVPYGKPRSLPTFDVERYEAAAAKLFRATLLNGGFAGALEEAGPGDVVYCDPPYLPAEGAQSFVDYTKAGFSLADQENLEYLARAATYRGATVLISNRDTPQARHLYKEWVIHEVSVPYSVGAQASSRGQTKELVAVLQPSALSGLNRPSQQPMLDSTGACDKHLQVYEHKNFPDTSIA